MPHKNSRQRTVHPTHPTVASLGLQVKLVARGEEEHLRALIERYEQLLCDWEHLSYQTLKVLADTPTLRTERHDAVRRA